MHDEVFLQLGQDEVRIGTLREIVDGHVNFGAIMEDIISDMRYRGEDNVSINIVIR